MTENEIARHVLDAAFLVHTKLGPGLFETVYEVVLAHELRQKKRRVERPVPMPITYDGVRFDEAYRVDLLVESKGTAELKISRMPDTFARKTTVDSTALGQSS